MIEPKAQTIQQSHKKINIFKRHPMIVTLLFLVCVVVVLYLLVVSTINRGIDTEQNYILGFENEYIEGVKNPQYTLKDSVDFELSIAPQESSETKKLLYAGVNEDNDNTVIFSFNQYTAPVDYNVIVTDIEGNETLYSAGFEANDNVAASIALKPKDSYKVFAECGWDNPVGGDSVKGRINIYYKK